MNDLPFNYVELARLLDRERERERLIQKRLGNWHANPRAKDHAHWQRADACVDLWERQRPARTQCTADQAAREKEMAECTCGQSFRAPACMPCHGPPSGD